METCLLLLETIEYKEKFLLSVVGSKGQSKVE